MGPPVGGGRLASSALEGNDAVSPTRIPPGFLPADPGLGYRFGADPRKGIESDEF